MTTTQATQQKKVHRPWLVVIIAGVVVIALGIAAIAVLFVINVFRPNPEFPPLSANPDPSLTGTVAYFDDATRCVRLVAASGAASKEVLCVESQTVDEASKMGKDVGYNIVWRDDTTLEVTQFLMVPGEKQPAFTPGWQKVIDVETGDVSDTPKAAIESTPTPPNRPTTSPTGETVTFENYDGLVIVTLTSDGQSRTIMEERGNPETYSLKNAFWAPNFDWVVADDNRILSITTGEPSQVRELTDALEFGYGYDELAWFDISPANLLDANAN